MNVNLLSIVKQIIDDQGDMVLSQPRRMSAYLADLAQDVPKPHKNAFIKCLEHGFFMIMKNAAETERIKCRQDLPLRLNKEEGLDLHLCEESISLLAAVLYGEETAAMIAEGAYENRQLTSFIIPENITVIGEWAFSCNELTSITIPNSVTTIGEMAFYKNHLDNIIIPNSVTKIGKCAFSYNKLTNAKIPESLNTICEGVFSCNRLTNVVIPAGVTAIEGSAFSKNQLTGIVIPATVTVIGHFAFIDNQLINIDIPESVTTIGLQAFSNNKLINITIGANIKLKTPVFENDFDEYYNLNGCRAGTYIRSTGGWRMK